MPLAVYAVMSYAQWKGHQFNVHGDLILVGVGLLFTGIIALLIEGYAVPHAWRLLRIQPSLRTPLNYIAFGFGALYLLFCIALFAWFVVATMRIV